MLQQIVGSPIFQISGWIFGLISVVIAVVQCREKNRLKQQLSMIDLSTTTVTMETKDNATAVNSNSGTINITR